MKPSTAETLKEYFSSGKNKEKWEQAKAAAKEAPSFGNYDDGKYNAQVTDIKIGRSKASNRLQATIALRFVGGEYAGKKFYKYVGIEDSVEYLLRDLATLGYDDVDLETLEKKVFEKIKKQKPTVKVKLDTKGEFQNVYLLEAGEESEEEENDDDNEESDDESEESDGESAKSDDEDDESGKEEPEDDDSDDDDDEEGTDKGDEEESEDDDDEDDEDEKEEVEDDEEKVILEKGMKLKVQVKNEVKIGTIVKLDEEDKDPAKHRAKVKFKDGEKVWVNADKIVDIVK